MKFHITITDNETGEVLHDSDACAIIAGINEGEKGSSAAMIDCGPIDLAEALVAAKKAARAVTDKYTEIGALTKLCEYLERKQSETEETKNEE